MYVDLHRPKNSMLKFYFIQWYNLQMLGISGDNIPGLLATVLLIKDWGSAWHPSFLGLANISFILSSDLITVLAGCSLSTPWQLPHNRPNSIHVSTNEI